MPNIWTIFGRVGRGGQIRCGPRTLGPPVPSVVPMFVNVGIGCVWAWTDVKQKVLTVFVNGGDCSVPLNVTFRPASADRFTADICISIRHNIYEDSFVQLIGEGYVETVTIDDVSCSDDFDPPLIPPAAAVEEDAEEDEEETPGSC